MYYILEIQKLGPDNFAHLVHTAQTRNQAESVYHQVLASAAIGNLELHAASMFSEEGFPIMNQAYRHEVVPVVEESTQSEEGTEEVNPLDI